MLKNKWIQSAYRYGLACLVIASCASDDNNRETITYTGPGSFYSAVLNDDNTFVIEKREAYGDATPTLTIEGEYESLDNGLIEFTVSTVDGTDEGPTPGEQAYAIEARGFGLFLLPLGGSEVIPMMAQGECPADDFVANWVVAQNSGGSDSLTTDGDFFGTFAYTFDSGEGEVVKRRNLVDFGEATGGTPVAFTTDSCEDGFLQISGGSETVNMWLTPIGGAMVEVITGEERNNTIFGLPRDTNELADLEGNFRGIVVDNSSNGDQDDNENFFIDVVFDDAGVGTGTEVTSINPWETGAALGEVRLEADADVGPGWYTGILDVDGAESNIACSFVLDIADTGNDILMCVGQSPGDIAESEPSATIINMILVKQSS